MEVLNGYNQDCVAPDLIESGHTGICWFGNGEYVLKEEPRHSETVEFAPLSS